MDVLIVQLRFINHFDRALRQPLHHDDGVRVVVGSLQNVVARRERVLGELQVGVIIVVEFDILVVTVRREQRRVYLPPRTGAVIERTGEGNPDSLALDTVTEDADLRFRRGDVDNDRNGTVGLVGEPLMPGGCFDRVDRVRFSAIGPPTNPPTWNPGSRRRVCCLYQREPDYPAVLSLKKDSAVTSLRRSPRLRFPRLQPQWRGPQLYHQPQAFQDLVLHLVQRRRRQLLSHQRRYQYR